MKTSTKRQTKRIYNDRKTIMFRISKNYRGTKIDVYKHWRDEKFTKVMDDGTVYFEIEGELVQSFDATGKYYSSLKSIVEIYESNMVLY